MSRLNVICATNNFGLGPVGKICSIVTAGKGYDWYAVGNHFDTSIFSDGLIKECLWSKDKNELKQFIKKNNISYAVVVLDSELTFILMELGVKVLFVDSLPFMWTQADIDEGLLPLNVDYYCAQKCINLTESSRKVLSQIKNLIWVNPIGDSEDVGNASEQDYCLINFGGLHSPFGNGEYYIDVICPALFKSLKEKGFLRLIVACGQTAKENLKEKFEFYARRENLDLTVETFTQEKFHKMVKGANLFITSPGLTTIYETMGYDKNTLLLPPQNLSQFYNIKYGKQLLKFVKAVNWDTDDLSDDGLEKILALGESKVVEIIYDRIRKLNSSEYIYGLYKRFLKELSSPFSKNNKQIKYENTGAIDICNLLKTLMGE